MKYKVIITLFFVFLIKTQLTSQNGYNIELKVKGFENKDVILGYYSNKSMYITDTATFNNSNIAVFKNEKPLPGGLYFLYLPNEKHFDILIDKEQNFKVETDTIDLVGKLTINGANEPKLFLEYQLFLKGMQSKATKLQENLQQTNDENQKEKIKEELGQLNTEVTNFMNNQKAKFPNTLYSAFIKGLQEPEMPDFNIPENISNKDSLTFTKQYEFYSKHFLDNIDFTDKRFLRLPFFAEKLDFYFDKVLVQHPDTISKAAIATIEKSRSDNEIFQFVTQYLFNKVNDNKIMGMENAMVALADKYYLSGEATWASDEFIEKLEKHLNYIRPTLIGNNAHDLMMESITGEYFKLYEINAPITIIVFYEPSCGHCKKDIPKLYKDVFEKFKNQGVKVFAVYSMNDKEEWQTFIDEHELFDWINVYDPRHETNFRYHYDIRATPTIFVLNKDKKIIAKRLDIDQIANFVEHKLQENL